VEEGFFGQAKGASRRKIGVGCSRGIEELDRKVEKTEGEMMEGWI
jgi:hypothetical protein